MDQINLKPLEDREDHFHLLQRWCGKEHVFRWFEQRKLSPEEITDKYRKKLSDNKQSLFLIYLGDVPIGFTQIYRYSGPEFDPLKQFESPYEFDIFIGEERFLSKGLGTAAVQAICSQIFRDYLADCVVVQPFERNGRALRCYKKAGFQFLGTYNGQDTPGNPETICVLNKTRPCDAPAIDPGQNQTE